MCDFLDYEQHLSDALEGLFFKAPQYEKLRELIKVQCQDKSDGVIFAVRKNEIHIYYLGGRILKITKSYNKLRFFFDLKYAKKQKASDELNEYGDIIKKLNENQYDVDLWVEHFNKLKLCMKNYRENVSPNPERQLQQVLELENRDFDGEVVIIDNEYGVREEHSKNSKLCKVDLVALYKDSAKYKICLIELKLGDGAIAGKAGITDHIKSCKLFLGKRKRDIIASVNNLIEYKKSNGFLLNAPSDIKLCEDTEICVSVLCYDLPEQKRSKAESFIEEGGKEISFELHFNTRLKSCCHILSKKDILGE